LRSSRKIPAHHACPRSLPSYPTTARIPGVSPPGSVDELSRCHHFMKVHDCKRQVSICVKCGLPTFGPLKFGVNRTNLPDGTLSGNEVGSAPPRRF